MPRPSSPSRRALPQPHRAEDDRPRRAARALPPGSQGRMDDHRLDPRRGGRPSLRPLRALDAPGRLDVPDHPRHEPLGARLSARRLRGRGARADPHRGGMVPVLGRTEPVAAPLVGLAVEASPPRAALLRNVLRAAVVPAHPRAARGHGRGLPPLCRRGRRRRCRGRPLGDPERAPRPSADRARGAARAARRDAGAPARARGRCQLARGAAPGEPHAGPPAPQPRTTRTLRLR